uniref:Uncharacterized protein n=1 Tax=Cannabis sativa TaxID=3483 RepID=A0A803PVX0_CANSA
MVSTAFAGDGVPLIIFLELEGLSFCLLVPVSAAFLTVQVCTAKFLLNSSKASIAQVYRRIVQKEEDKSTRQTSMVTSEDESGGDDVVARIVAIEVIRREEASAVAMVEFLVRGAMEKKKLESRVVVG